MRTALYLRVSTSHQKLDLQADGLRHYATRAGLEIIAEYVDVAVSGRKEGRPQLQALMRSARDHEFDCVLVWKFDRFARSVAHLLSALDEFHHLGIRFISVQDQVDTESPMGKAMFTIIGDHGRVRIVVDFRASQGRNGSCSCTWQAARTADDTSTVRRAYRRARGYDGYEYSPNSGRITRQSE